MDRKNNLGVEKANNEYILILSPDTEVDPNLLNKLIKSQLNLEKINNTDKIILGPRICLKEGSMEYSRRNINFLGYSNIDVSKSNKIRRTMIISGCAFLIKKTYFDRLKGFDESYFMYHEDIDFSIRAALNGFKLYINNSIHLFHLKSDENFKLNKFKYYFHERNRIKFSLEHSKRKKKMIFAQLIFEPFHLIFAFMNGFIKERIKVYKYLIQNIFSIFNNKEKENDYFDIFFDMNGIFNEVNPDTIIFRILNLLSRCLFYYYHH